MTRNVFLIAIIVCWGYLEGRAQFSDPTCSQDLTAWYTADASALTKNGSDEVSQVNDRSSGSLDLTQSTTANKPLWVDDVVNGNPVLRFDGNDVLDLASVASSSLRTNNTVAIYAVVSVTGSGTIFNHESSTTAGDGKFSIESSGAYWAGDGDADKTNFTLGSTWQIVHYRVEWSVPAADYLTVYEDGDESAQKTYTAASPISPSNSTVTGTLQLGASSGGFTGDLAEIFIFDVTHGASPREQFHTYLSNKYGISLDHSDVDVDYRDSDQNVLWDLSASCSQTGFETNVTSLMRDDCYPQTNETQVDPIGVTTFTSGSLSDDDYVLWGSNSATLTNNWTTTNMPTGVGSRFTREWKVRERAGTGSIGSITVDFNVGAYIDNSHTISNVWILIDTDDDGLYNDNPGGASVTNPSSWNQSGGYGSFSHDFSTCDAFTIGFTTSTPLPVELISFEGHVVGNKEIRLDWVTAQEIDNEKFIVQKSENGLDWSPIGEVLGVGNSDDDVYYTFTDKDPDVGVNYYRLKQVDFDGTSALSEEIPVEFMSTHLLTFNTFPNPATSTISVAGLEESEGPIWYKLSDINGRVLLNGPFNNEIGMINVEEVSKGTYFLEIQSGTKSNRSKVIIN